MVISLKSSHIKEILKGSYISLTMRLGGYALAFIFLIVISRLFGLNVLGVFAISISFLEILSIIGNLGIQKSVQRFVCQYVVEKKEDRLKGLIKNIIIIVLPITLLISLILYLMSSYFANSVFKIPELEITLRIVAITIPFLSFNKIFIELLRSLKMIQYSEFFRDISSHLFKIIFLLILLRYSNKIFIPILSVSLSIILTFLLIIFIISKKVIYQKNLSKNGRITINKILNVSMPLLIASFAVIIFDHVGTLVLGYFTTSNQVGIFKILFKLAVVINIISYSVIKIACPQCIQYYWDKQFKKLRHSVKDSSKLIFLGTLPILISIIIFYPYLLKLFGIEFGIDRIIIIFISLSFFLNAVTPFVGILLTLTGYERDFAKILIITSLFKIILDIFLISKYNLIGASFSLFLATIFWITYSTIIIKKKIGVFPLYIPFYNK